MDAIPALRDGLLFWGRGRGRRRPAGSGQLFWEGASADDTALVIVTSADSPRLRSFACRIEYRLKWYFCGLPRRNPTALNPGKVSKMILQMAVTGRASTSPARPHSLPNSSSEKIATSGLMLTLEPTTYGVMRFPSSI